jgi:hypothetical protein
MPEDQNQILARARIILVVVTMTGSVGHYEARLFR